MRVHYDPSYINEQGGEHMEKQKVPDIPIVPYTTCEQYREYMGGIPDDNSTIKHNPHSLQSWKMQLISAVN